MDPSPKNFIQDLVDAHNKLRTDPTSFLPMLEERLAKFEGNEILQPDGVWLVTKEGPKAVE